MNNEQNQYIIAILTNEQYIKPLFTGKVYGREEAIEKANKMQETCEYELKALDGERFIAYSLISE